MAEPYLLVSCEGTACRTEGTAALRLGHEIPRPGGSQPDGVFGGWSWDGSLLRADGDRYGLYPLFYYTARDRFAISPSIPTLLSLGAPRDLDESALAVFLRLGFFLAEDTPFMAIRALPPRAVIEWTGGGLTVNGGMPEWRTQSLTRDAAIDGYIELFRAAMARRARPDDEVALPLSSGRDSRHILFEMLRAGRRPKFCVTMRHYPPTSNEDATVASLLARRTGIPHVILPRGRSRIAAELRKNRITSFCADEHGWLLPLAEYLRGRVASIYDGIGGDVLSAGLNLNEARLGRFARGEIEQLAVEFLRGTEARTMELVAADWAERLGHDRAVARLTGELARHAGAPNPIGSFFFWNRTRREISQQSYGILNQGVEVLAPYLDHDLFDFLSSLPAAMLLDRKFHGDTIRRGFPEYNDVRYEDRSVRSWWAPFHFRRSALEVAGLARQSRRGRPGIELVNRSTVLRRTFAGAALGSRAGFDWRMMSFAVYLMQLSEEVG